MLELPGDHFTPRDLGWSGLFLLWASQSSEDVSVVTQLVMLCGWHNRGKQCCAGPNKLRVHSTQAQAYNVLEACDGIPIICPLGKPFNSASWDFPCWWPGGRSFAYVLAPNRSGFARRFSRFSYRPSTVLFARDPPRKVCLCLLFFPSIWWQGTECAGLSEKQSVAGVSPPNWWDDSSLFGQGSKFELKSLDRILSLFKISYIS